MTRDTDQKTRRLGPSPPSPTVIDAADGELSGRQTSQLPVDDQPDLEPPRPAVASHSPVTNSAQPEHDTGIITEEEVETGSQPAAGQSAAPKPATAVQPAVARARSRAWIVLLGGLLGLGAGAAAGFWLPAGAPIPREVELPAGEQVTHLGWTLGLVSKERQQGAHGSLLLLHLEVWRDSGSATDTGRYLLLDVGQVSRVPAFWSTSGGDLKIAFTLLGKQNGPLGLRFTPPGLNFWPPGTPALLMKLK